MFQFFFNFYFVLNLEMSQFFAPIRYHSGKHSNSWNIGERNRGVVNVYKYNNVCHIEKGSILDWLGGATYAQFSPTFQVTTKFANFFPLRRESF